MRAIAILRKILMLGAIALLLCTGNVQAQSADPSAPEAPQASPASKESSDSLASRLAGQPGTVGEALMNFASKFQSFRTGMTAGATTLSGALRTESDKIAFGLGVITLTLAFLQFAATSDAVAAWTGVFETLLTLGIFAAIYGGYESFGPGIFEWFKFLAAKITGTDASNPTLVLASLAGGFLDSFQKLLAASKWYEVLGVAIAGFLLVLAFIACALTALVYMFFNALGEIQVAVGIVLGPLAVALGFSDYTRRFFNSWLDFMISGSMYTVVAAIMSKLVVSAFKATVIDVQSIGTASMAGAAYALFASGFILLVALEIPKIAGAIFGGGGGVSGGGFLRMAGKGAWNLGAKLANRAKS